MTALMEVFVRVIRVLASAAVDLWPWAEFETLSRSASELVLNGLWQGMLLGAVVWLVLRLFRNLNAATRYMVWFATLVAVIALPVLSGRHDLSSLAGFVSSVTSPAPEQYSESCTDASATADPVVASTNSAKGDSRGAKPERAIVRRAGVVRATGAPRRSDAPIELTGTAWPVAVFGLWLCLGSLMLGRVVWSYVSVQKLKDRSSPLPPKFQYRLRHWLRRYGVRRPVLLCRSSELSVPAAIGLRNPVIVIPEHLVDALSESEMDQIGLHELAHIKRYDDWTNLIQHILRAVFFFHPAVILICKRLNLEREIACDDWVLSATEAPRPYASCLARLAELTRFPVKPLPVPGAIVTKKQIVRRIETMLNRKDIVNPRMSRRGAGLGLAALTLAVMPFLFVAPVISVSAAPPEPATPRPPVAPRPERLPAVPDVPDVPDLPSPRAHESTMRDVERQLERAQEELRKADRSAPEAAMREAERELRRAMEAARDAYDLSPEARRDMERELKLAQEELRKVDRSAPEAAMREAERELERAMEAARAAERVAPEARRALERDLERAAALTPAPEAPAGRTYAGLFDSWTENRNDDGTTISWSDGSHRVRIETDGEIEFTDDETGIESLSADAYFIIEEKRRGQTRELEVQTGRDGKPEYYYEVNRKSQEFDAEGRAWLAELLPTMLRQTGVGIENRVDRILEKHGVDGVLREISLVEGDYMKRIHFQELATHGPFDAAAMQKMFRQIGLEMEGDYDKAELLIQFAPYIGNEHESRKLYFQAVTGLDSDYDMRRVLDAMIDEGAVDEELAADVLDAAEQLGSDYERAELLIAMADYGRGSGPARDAYMRAVAGMDSDYEKRRALSALADTDTHDTAFVASTLAVAESIDSDYERAEMLVGLADKAATSEGLMRVYLRAATDIGSDYEKGRALSALPLDETTSKETLLDVLGAVETIEGDWEKTEFLKKIAPLYMEDDELKDAFADAVDTISSDYEREQMYSMLWKKGRTPRRGTH
jgi:beta-lactamase regulating signal transducer with metallopeptidase domain